MNNLILTDAIVEYYAQRILFHFNYGGVKAADVSNINVKGSEIRITGYPVTHVHLIWSNGLRIEVSRRSFGADLRQEYVIYAPTEHVKPETITGNIYSYVLGNSFKK